MKDTDIVQAIELAGASYIDSQAQRSGTKTWMLDDIRSGVQCFFRLSGRELYITFRGTDSAADWRGNFRFAPKVIPYDNTETRIRVHSGFLDAYKSRGVRLRVLETVSGVNSVRICGHSLGAALAVLAAVDIQYNFPECDIEVFLFGCPRVGNRAFALSYNKRVVKTIRVENGNDIVTKIPPAIFGFRHVGAAFPVGRPRIPLLFSFHSHYPHEYYSSLLKRLF